MATRRQPNPLHIDELPDDIIKKILTHLPILDAVRTSVLAKKWRYSWTQIPELIFDERICDDPIINSERKLIIAINQVLLFHGGPLHGFTLSLFGFFFLKVLIGSISCIEIDQFVLASLTKEVKSLTLESREYEDYRLPSSVFTYGQQLEKLHLRFCILKPPQDKGFSNLKHLWLEEAEVEIYLCEVEPNENEASETSMLHGKLPVVEKLTVEEFYSKSLTSNRTPTSLVNDLCHLKSLTLEHNLGSLDKVTSVLCLIRNSPNLEKLTVVLVENIFQTLDIDLTKVEGFSDVTLDRLRKAELTMVSGSQCEMQFIELILAKSPVLEKFLIKQNFNLVSRKGRWFKRQLARFQHASPLVKIVCD